MGNLFCNNVVIAEMMFHVCFSILYKVLSSTRLNADMTVTDQRTAPISNLNSSSCAESLSH